MVCIPVRKEILGWYVRKFDKLRNPISNTWNHFFNLILKVFFLMNGLLKFGMCSRFRP